MHLNDAVEGYGASSLSSYDTCYRTVTKCLKPERLFEHVQVEMFERSGHESKIEKLELVTRPCRPS
jgi:hypothetical protein